MHLEEVETPVAVIDYGRLIANIERAQEIARRHGVALRPHVKTHKCLPVAELQLAHGAVGLTASKVDEALAFMGGKAKSITVAYPVVDQRKFRRLLHAAEKAEIEIGVLVDSGDGLRRLREAAAECSRPPAVFLKIDVGLHRCGVAENDPQLTELAQAIAATPRLRFAGLLSHAGHAYAAENRDRIAAIAADECAILLRIRRRLEAAGIDVKEVSVGSTPTVLASEMFDGITEIRPGNYVFLDATAVRLGLATFEQVALTVVATIVSANREYFIIDAGSKVLSSDLGAHGTGGGFGFGIVFPFDAKHESAVALKLVKLSEEHGFVERGGADLQVGMKVRIIPNHSCPVANLANELTIVSGHEVVDRWEVAARGCVR